ncbi:MAG: DUF1761 domain-containing protein [Acidobacteriaceae bacterium]
MRTFRIYWPAAVVAMIASFLFDAAWFSYFRTQWLAGIGKTMESLQQSGVNPAIQYGTALLCSFVAAIVLSICIQATGEQTLRRGIACGAFLWLGFVATSFAKYYIFEVRPLQLYAINMGDALIGMVLMGAIVGAWRGKARG